jgi:SAM-dependent methyltransferase
MLLKSIAEKIKQKKELSGIDDSIVSELVQKYLEKNRIPLENLKESYLKIIVKDIRSNLRDYAGRFQIGWKDRYKLLEKGDINSLLKTHSSTSERIAFYPRLKELISRLKARSILDLGCGINPIALASPGVVYYASDINGEELKLIEKFFEKNNIKGKTFVCDLANVNSCNLPEADICLILKVFDILGKNDYLLAEKVISRIKSKYLLISFSTKTLSGKPMNKPRRIWLEKLLEKLNYSFEIIKSDNEIFYLSKTS